VEERRGPPGWTGEGRERPLILPVLGTSSTPAIYNIHTYLSLLLQDPEIYVQRNDSGGGSFTVLLRSTYSPGVKDKNESTIERKKDVEASRQEVRETKRRCCRLPVPPLVKTLHGFRLARYLSLQPSKCFVRPWRPVMAHAYMHRTSIVRKLLPNHRPGKRPPRSTGFMPRVTKRAPFCCHKVW
jgi:hypothetical protein